MAGKNPFIKLKLGSGAPLVIRGDRIESVTLEHEHMVIITTSGQKHFCTGKVANLVQAIIDAEPAVVRQFVSEVAKDAEPLEKAAEERIKRQREMEERARAESEGGTEGLGLPSV